MPVVLPHDVLARAYDALARDERHGAVPKWSAISSTCRPAPGRSSQYGEDFSKADAIYAVDHVDVNWNEQAAKAAKSYLETGSFSRNGLIQQLSSSYGDGFTHAQAVYGVNKAYR